MAHGLILAAEGRFMKLEPLQALILENGEKSQIFQSPNAKN